MAKTILVTAATGAVGQLLVPRLLALGHKVRAASRGGAKDSVALDFAKPETFAAALDGVDAVYLVIPTGTLDPLSLEPFITAAAAKGVKLVLQTAIGVDANDDIPYRKLELSVEASGAPFVFLRPNWFMDNFHTYWRPGIVQHGVIALPVGDARSSLVDARDIADAAVVALTTSEHDGQAYVLTGPESITYQAAAETLSTVLGRSITFQPVDHAGFLEFAAKSGLGEGHAQMLATIFYPVAQGWTAVDSGDVERLTGRRPRSLVDYIADNAARF